MVLEEKKYACRSCKFIPMCLRKRERESGENLRRGRIGVRSSQKSRSIFVGRDRGNATAGTIDPLRKDRKVGLTCVPLCGLRFGISYFLSSNTYRGSGYRARRLPRTKSRQVSYRTFRLTEWTVFSVYTGCSTSTRYFNLYGLIGISISVRNFTNKIRIIPKKLTYTLRFMYQIIWKKKLATRLEDDQIFELPRSRFLQVYS